MRAIRRWMTAAALTLVAACGGSPPAEVRVGGPAPDFELTALDGRRVSSRSLEGKPLILNFWATWCQPCRKEFPVLQTYAADPRVNVVAVALDEDGERSVRPFVEREGLSYTVVLGDQELFQRFNGFAIPYTLVLDPSRTVVSIYRGPAEGEALERDLRSIEEAKRS